MEHMIIHSPNRFLESASFGSDGYHVRQLTWCMPDVVGSGHMPYDTKTSLPLISSRENTMSNMLGQPCMKQCLGASGGGSALRAALQTLQGRRMQVHNSCLQHRSSSLLLVALPYLPGALTGMQYACPMRPAQCTVMLLARARCGTLFPWTCCTHLKSLGRHVDVQWVLPNHKALLRAHGPLAAHFGVGDVRAALLREACAVQSCSTRAARAAPASLCRRTERGSFARQAHWAHAAGEQPHKARHAASA